MTFCIWKYCCVCCKEKRTEQELQEQRARVLEAAEQRQKTMNEKKQLKGALKYHNVSSE
jgi:hypothetical protein